MEPSQHRLVSILEKLVSFELDLKPFQEQLLGFQVVLTELNREISSHLFEELDERELARLRKRQSELNQLFLKYGVNLEAVQKEYRRLIRERERILGSIGSLEGRREELSLEYGRLLNRKSKLDEMRRKKSRNFEKELEHVLKKLSFPHARMVTRWRVADWPEELPADPGLSLPRTQLTFMFSPNPGEEPRPLHKVASGGELSRVMLALIVSLNREEGKTLIFDEVDAGLGGETASAVGEILASLGQNNQVLCVTHLAQVAQFAGTHWRVLKETDSRRTITSFHRLSGESRIEEIARLMGGDSSAQGLKQHAHNMLRKCGMAG
jgi:DNA repair protein RecN (Recombination protein N)